MIVNNLKVAYHHFTKKRWNIGFVEFTSLDYLFKNTSLEIKWMEHHYTDRWFADPFILNINSDEIELLVEEMNDKMKRGRISKLVVDRKSYVLKKCKTVLELDSHLSFPALFRFNDVIYIYPENSEAGKLQIYRYNEKKEKAILVKDLLDLPLTDAIIKIIENVPYLFSTRLPYQNENILDIYIDRECNGRYMLHQTMSLTDKVARNAGDFFEWDESLIRPSQDCNYSYGSGIVFQKVLLKDEVFSFEEIKRFYPSSWRYHLGLHTFNMQGKIAVVDGKGFCYPLIGYLLEYIKKKIKR